MRNRTLERSGSFPSHEAGNLQTIRQVHLAYVVVFEEIVWLPTQPLFTEIATTIHELQGTSEEIKSDPTKLKVLFNEMIQMCLWGNATDLSLLTHLTQNDIHNLQTVGKEAQLERQKFILKDDEESVWKHIQTLKDGQVDFVLDNSGFEVTLDYELDCCPKLIPWFVSDVTPPDFKETFEVLSNPEFFEKENSADLGPLREMVSRWKSYVDNGVFRLSVPISTPLGGGDLNDPAQFWTTAKPYWNMKMESPVTFTQLAASDLVIFKLQKVIYVGLLGHPSKKQLVSGASLDQVGPLAGSFPLLSLRTNKADVVVGVEEEVAKRLDATDEKWRVDGRYALISFLPRL
ncbi:hypothetical protein D9613_003784 [Agrocybe pediades]|uniref:Sugar phosphate phosphatase n=1 Tax=Agrocybe pediades TaxID=84607 RepID=A0A8H4QJD0_9AGAR|nr:hypothetical protein D9613_003784 [Agrocybe pediades]